MAKKEKTQAEKAAFAGKAEFWIYTAVYFVLGILFLIFSSQVTTAICYILGAAMLVTGVAEVIFFLSQRGGADFGQRIGLIVGVILGVLGVIILINPSLLSGVINWLFGIVLVVDGVIKLKTALETKSSSTGWWLSLIFAVVAFILGVALMLMPVDQSVLIILTGIFFLVVAALNVFSYIYIRRTAKELSPVVVEVDFTDGGADE